MKAMTNTFTDTFTQTVTKTVSPSATNMIRMDHTRVLTTFHQYEIDASPQTKQGLVNAACIMLEIHAQVEEEIFYPAMRTVAADAPIVEKSIPEHNEMRRLIGELRSMSPTNPLYDQTFMELMRDVLHHVADEETTLLPDAERLLGDRVNELGAQMTKRRMQLAAPYARELAVNKVRGMPAKSMLVAAGALVAGTYLMRRRFARHA